MPLTARAVRVERAEAIGRAAYRLARSGDIFGNLDIEGQAKRPTEYRRGAILVELWEAWRSTAAETEFSPLRVTYGGEKVLELRWIGRTISGWSSSIPAHGKA